MAGAAFGAASAVFYAGNVLVGKSLVPVFSGSEIAFFHGLIAVPLLLFLVPTGAWGHLEPAGVTWLLAGAAFAGAGGGLLFVWGLRRIPASRASNLTLLEPLVATVLASLVFSEPLAPLSVVGGGFILGGAALAVTAKTPEVQEN